MPRKIKIARTPAIVALGLAVLAFPFACAAAGVLTIPIVLAVAPVVMAIGFFAGAAPDEVLYYTIGGAMLLAAALMSWRVYADLRWETIDNTGRYCLRCGYDLTGNVSGRCPECGRELTDDEGAANGSRVGS
ncbi:MAG: hypothetical protein PVJ57_20700 [Phycisphaerae bacterium]|jgi:hypothetical protein